MSEFREVIRQANRLCKCKQDDRCNNSCPLHFDNNGRNLICTTLKSDYPEEYEAIVMNWAKENPAPTNFQKMIEIITEAFGEQIALDFMNNRRGCSGFGCPTDRDCTECKYKEFWENEYQSQKGE